MKFYPEVFIVYWNEYDAQTFFSKTQTLRAIGEKGTHPERIRKITRDGQVVEMGLIQRDYGLSLVPTFVSDVLSHLQHHGCEE